MRACIGESFAWMEGILVLAILARHWKMRLVRGHRVELDPRITLRPKYGMKVKLERRH
jgi:cytochrome P450